MFGLFFKPCYKPFNHSLGAIRINAPRKLYIENQAAERLHSRVTLACLGENRKFLEPTLATEMFLDDKRVSVLYRILSGERGYLTRLGLEPSNVPNLISLSDGEIGRRALPQLLCIRNDISNSHMYWRLDSWDTSYIAPSMNPSEPNISPLSSNVHTSVFNSLRNAVMGGIKQNEITKEISNVVNLLSAK